MDCIAHRQVEQEVSITKGQPKEMASKENGWQTPPILIELLQGKKVIDHDFETEIEES